jgi:flagellar hook-basal body complex protein FliE
MPAPISSVGTRVLAQRLEAMRATALGDAAGTVQVPAMRPGTAGAGEAQSFGDTLKSFVGEVSAQQDASAELRDRFLRGEQVELHQVMAAGEEATLSLELMVALRDKVTEAYRTLISMQG